MNKEFVTYALALDLKELGFDEDCLSNYYKDNSDRGKLQFTEYNDRYFIKAPLYQQAFRWFREKYKELKFFIKEEDFREGLYEYDIKDVLGVSGFKTYEEAELECLKKLIEIVKEKNE